MGRSRRGLELNVRSVSNRYLEVVSDAEVGGVAL